MHLSYCVNITAFHILLPLHVQFQVSSDSISADYMGSSSLYISVIAILLDFLCFLVVCTFSYLVFSVEATL